MWSPGSIKRDEATEPHSAQAVSPAPPGEERRVTAWVGKSVIFKGSLVSAEDMTIDGRVEGTIEVRDQGLTVGPDADIRADITANRVTVYGTVTGNIRANARIDVGATGQIEGDLIAPRIVVVDGAVVSGRVETTGKHSGKAESRGALAMV